MTIKDIYLNQTREKMEQRKKHLELNRKCLYIKMMFSKLNIRPKIFYDEILCPEIKNTGVFCKRKKDKLLVKNGKYIPKSFPLFRKYLEINKILQTDLISRQELIDRLTMYVMAIDRMWMQKIQEIGMEIMDLESLIDSNKKDPRDFTEETLQDYIERIKKHGLKM